MGFTSSQPTQHGEILSQRRPVAGQPVINTTGNINATRSSSIAFGPSMILGAWVALMFPVQVLTR